MQLNKRIKNVLKRNFIDLDLSNRSTIFISGMGRSGTTWLSNVINYNNSYRDIFEPFFPYNVKEASIFKYLHYIHPDTYDIELQTSAKNILSGKIRNQWTDVNINKFFYTKRIIKDIRTNLMLGWLKNIRPNMPTILIIRSPYSVIDSYKQLGWGIEAGGKKSDFERIKEQEDLFVDFPVIKDICGSIGKKEYIEQLAFQWCVMNYVPLKQLSEGNYILIHYEDLLLRPENILIDIFKYLKLKVDLSQILERIERPSVTNYRNINFNTNKNKLIEKWKISLSKSEIEKINIIINKFDLNHLYDQDGHPS